MRRTVTIGLLLLSLTSCVHVFTVRVAPGTAGPVFFLAGSAPLDFRRCIKKMVVRPSGDRQPLWSIERVERCPTTTRFTYGVLPAGWKEVVAPARLQAGASYDVTVSTPGGTGSRTFLADGTEMPRVLSNPPRR